ncbi:MAG: hypothetical protein J0H92_10560 [Sphingobacteriales bacterium]|nr:hypothetical protein [Sphingobacteriales bacterium]OJW31793.1 MAG: hypothetical protein BGO54_15240 [Sphingobacteriales bacterium 46-32]
MNDNQIINTALAQLTNQTGLKADWKPQDGEVDGEVDFHFPKGNLQLFAEIRRELRLHQLDKIVELAGRYRPFIVVAETIFPALKERLRDKRIGYIDAAGNIYINEGNHFIWIEGHKPQEKKKMANNRAFTKTGLKMVFYLLLNDAAINMPYRKLADATGVALGNVKNIIEGLKDAGFIIAINDTTLKLQNKAALLDRWLTGFRETLQPALLLGTYRFWDKKRLGDWQALQLDATETQWGGEPAGELLTNHLVPAGLTVYTHQNNELAAKWTLVPDEKGNVHVYEKFWKDEELDRNPYAPPLLVYADLMLTNDPRCQETAAMIYNKYLKDGLE